MAFDVFISYRHGGQCGAWVREVLTRRLRSAGLDVCIDVDSFRLGLPLVLEMARAVEQSRYTLAVLTPAYLESSFTELEGVLAEHLGLETSQQRLLVVRREACEPPLALRARLVLDMQDDVETERTMARLVDVMGRSTTGSRQRGTATGAR
jgi:hypothetical protein